MQSNAYMGQCHFSTEKCAKQTCHGTGSQKFWPPFGFQEIDKFDEKIEFTAVASAKTPHFT